MRRIDERADGYEDVLAHVYAVPLRAQVIGITGSPGAGKSTLVDALISIYRERGMKVGVVAVDPSSPFSGGAVLGDRVRMQRHFLDENVFIRSLATRGHLGGLSRSTADVMLIMNAWGADIILVETVGVGQDEFDVFELVDATCVVLAPGLGDDIQATKAGILEVADIFIVNKADREGADKVVHDLESMIALGEDTGGYETDHWKPRVEKTSAVRGEGIAELVAHLDAHKQWLSHSESGQRRRKTRTEARLRRWVRDMLFEKLEVKYRALIESAVQKITQGEIDPSLALQTLFELTDANPAQS